MNVKSAAIRLFTGVLAVGAISAGIVSPAQAISGGREAVENEYPGMLSLADYGGEFCGATLISGSPGQHALALTAAHCLKDRHVSQIWVRGGSLRWYEGDAARIHKVHFPPAYTPDVHGGQDVVVLELDHAPSGARPVRLARPGQPHLFLPYASVFMAGWGYTDPAKSVGPTVLHTIGLPMIPADVCREDPTYFLCAQGFHGAGGMHGDSGGPWIVDDVLIGVLVRLREATTIARVNNDFAPITLNFTIAVRIDALHDWLTYLQAHLGDASGHGDAPAVDGNPESATRVRA